MNPLKFKKLKGCFTRQKYLEGCTLQEIEKRLGFREGRLSKGAYFYRAEELPEPSGFDLGGYTQISTDRFSSRGKTDKEKFRRLFGNQDEEKLKGMARESWRLSGSDALIKVEPVIPHSEIESYPPGLGVPQWVLTSPIPCRLMAFLKEGRERLRL